MTFDELLDAVDAAVRERAPAAYGLFRGPAVAFWQRGERMARLRDGTGANVELTITGDDDAPLVVSREAASVAALAGAVAGALGALARER